MLEGHGDCSGAFATIAIRCAVDLRAAILRVVLTAVRRFAGGGGGAGFGDLRLACGGLHDEVCDVCACGAVPITIITGAAHRLVFLTALLTGGASTTGHISPHIMSAERVDDGFTLTAIAVRRAGFVLTAAAATTAWGVLREEPSLDLLLAHDAVHDVSADAAIAGTIGTGGAAVALMDGTAFSPTA